MRPGLDPKRPRSLIGRLLSRHAFEQGVKFSAIQPDTPALGTGIEDD